MVAAAVKASGRVATGWIRLPKEHIQILENGKTPDEYLPEAARPRGRESRSGANWVSTSQWPYGHGEGKPNPQGGPTLDSEALMLVRGISSHPTASWLPYGYIPRHCWSDVITYRAAIRGFLSSSIYAAVRAQ